jgi:hypothetical protein
MAEFFLKVDGDNYVRSSQIAKVGLRPAGNDAWVVTVKARDGVTSMAYRGEDKPSAEQACETLLYMLGDQRIVELQ